MDVDIKLKAFVPHLTPRSVAVLFRMADRAQTFAQYASYWQSRPPVPVGRSPSMWWKHAGSAAARECRLISRRQVSLLEHFAPFPVKHCSVTLTGTLGGYREAL